jgi:hypothetical protein
LTQLRLLALLTLVLFFTIAGHAQGFADFPFGDSSTTSPDKRFTLEAGHCDSKLPDACERKLWLVDNQTHERRIFLEFPRCVRIAWAPVGNAVLVNDDESSSDAEAYLYLPGRRVHFDLGKLIDGKFPADRRFERDSHHYVNGIRWVSPDAFIVRRFGHFDRRDGGEFSVCYRVSTSGSVTRLKETQSEESNCAGQ